MDPIDQNTPPIDPNLPPNGTDIPPNLPPNGNSSAFTIPDEFKDKGWAKTIKSFDDLVKGYDGAMSLIGKRQKPESADSYEIEAGHRSEAEVKALKGMLFEAGVSNDQAKKLIENLDKVTKSHIEKTKGDDAQLEAQLVARFGANYDVLKNKTKELVSTLMPDKAEQLQNMGIAETAAFVELVNHYEAKIKGITQEDSTFMGDGSHQSGGAALVKSEIEKQIAAIRSGKDYFDDNPFNPEAIKAKQKMKELYDKLAKLK